MSAPVSIRLRGTREAQALLSRLTPADNSEILRSAFEDSIGPRLVAGIQGFLRGPRPGRLGRVSGSLHDSVSFTVRGARLEAGVPDSHFWFDLHEFGSPGGRKQKRRKTRTRGYPARPAVQPGVEEAVASGDLAAGLASRWEAEGSP